MIWQGIQSYIFQDLIERNLPENGDQKRAFEMTVMVAPLELMSIPPSKIMAREGSDVTLEWIYTEHLDPAFPNYDIERIFLAQFKYDIDFNNPQFRQSYQPMFIQDGQFNTKDPRITLNIETKAEGNKLEVKVILIIQDIRQDDQSLITFEIPDTYPRPVGVSFLHSIIVSPNTQLIPEGYLGVVMDHWMSPDSPYVGLYEGKLASVICYGIGDDISEIYLTKDGERVQSDGEHLLSHRMAGSSLEYYILKVSEADLGTYTCYAEDTSGRIVKEERPAVMAEKVQAHLQLVSWDSDQVCTRM